MKISDVIPYVRVLINDKDSLAYRYSDTDLLLFANDALRRMSIIRPDIFITFQTLLTEPGTVLQKVPNDVDELVDVRYVIGGSAVREFTVADSFIGDPEWPNRTPGKATSFARDEKSTRFYYVSPPAPDEQSLVCQVIKVPQPTTISEDIEFNRRFQPILVDAIVFLSQSIDDEHISSGRSEKFYNLMINGLSSDYQSKKITDEDGGVEYGVRKV